MAHRKAIIIGGGPAGLSTALRLHQITNISCAVYEIRSQPATLGGAIGIPCNGMRLLQRLGLHDEFRARGNGHSKITIRSLQGNILGEQDIVGWARKQTGFGYLRIKRTDILDVMIEAAHKADIPILYNKRLVSIEEKREGVKVTFSDGTIDTADFLLGCDGIHSSVRQLYVDPLQAPEYSGLAGLCSLIPTSDLSTPSAKLRGINATLTQEGLFMAMTCTASDEEAYWSFSTEVPLPVKGDARDGWEVHHKEEVEKFKKTMLGLLANAEGEWGSTIKEIVEKTSVLKLYPVYKLPLGGTWFKGRCLLLGDAAHAMLPHAGQGVSMALEDTFLLSRLLQDETRPFRDVFEKFERIRRPRVDEIANVAVRNSGFRKKSGPWALWFKELGIRAYMHATWVPGWDPKLSSAQKQLVYDVDAEEL